MQLLLDTHTIIWHINGDAQLSAKALALVSDENNVRWVSPASIWEIAIKVNLGKLQLKRSFPDLNVFLSTNKFLWLPIEFEHAVRASQLPLIHRDPFDRMLVAQALPKTLLLLPKTRTFRFMGWRRYGEY